MDTRREPQSERPSHFQHYAPLWRILIGLSIALLVAVFFFSPVVLTAFTTPITAVGLDPLSTGLITALFLIASAALTSAMVSRQRLGTVIGAGVTYSLSYVPSNPRRDGTFRKIDVKLRDGNFRLIQSRQGYYALESTK